MDFLKARKRQAPDTKASATGRVAAWGSSGRVAWSPRDTVSLTRAGFAGNPVGFRAVKMVAEAAAALPLVCQDAKRRFEVHPVLSLVGRPNAAQGRAEFFEALFAQLLLSGDGYVEAVGGETGVPGRAACSAFGPDEPGARGRRLAGGLRICSGRQETPVRGG